MDTVNNANLAKTWMEGAESLTRANLKLWGQSGKGLRIYAVSPDFGLDKGRF